MSTLNTSGLIDVRRVVDDLACDLERGFISQPAMSSLESALPSAIDKNFPVQTFSKTPSTLNINAAKKAHVDATFSVEMASGVEELSIMLGYMTILDNQRMEQRLKQLHTTIDDGLARTFPSEEVVDIRSVLES